MLNVYEIEEVIREIPYDILSGKTVLITGANGFLASNIIHVIMYLNDKYLRNKCTVIALCRNKEKGEKIFCKYVNSNYFKIIIQNIENEINLSQDVDYIFHAASNATTKNFRKEPVEILMPNIIGTYNLLEYAKNKKIKGFLFFSSGAVYGDLPIEINRIMEEKLFNLQSFETKNCYAEGKRAGEALCKAYWEEYKVPTKIVRISHTYGPGIDLNDGRVFSDFVKSICSNDKLIIKGNGKDIRPFCYITDAITAFFIILFKGENGQAYNMANSLETYTIYELAQKLVGEVFAERKLQIKGNQLDLKSEVRKTYVDTEKLQKLGWTPYIDVVEGFRRTVQSFEENRK